MWQLKRLYIKYIFIGQVQLFLSKVGEEDIKLTAPLTHGVKLSVVPVCAKKSPWTMSYNSIHKVSAGLRVLDFVSSNLKYILVCILSRNAERSLVSASPI